VAPLSFISSPLNIGLAANLRVEESIALPTWLCALVPDTRLSPAGSVSETVITAIALCNVVRYMQGRKYCTSHCTRRFVRF
jgi:hypothetical protein